MPIKKYSILLVLSLIYFNSFALAQDSDNHVTESKESRNTALDDLKTNKDDEVLFVQKENLVEEREKKVIMGKQFPYVLQTKDYEKISFFLKHGANINIPIYEKNTAVHISAMHGDIEYLNFLIKNKANLLLVNARNQNILYLAAQGGNVRYLEELKEVLKDKEFTIMLTQKADFGRSPIHALVLSNKTKRADLAETLLFLVKNGADINAKDENGQTPLHYMAAMREWKTLEVLLKLNGGMQIKDNNDKTVQDYVLERMTITQIHGVYKYMNKEGKSIIEEKFQKIGLIEELVPYGYVRDSDKIPEPLEASKKQKKK